MRKYPSVRSEQESGPRTVRVLRARDKYIVPNGNHTRPLARTVRSLFFIPTELPGSLKLKTPWSESASELYRPSDRRLSAKRLPTCADPSGRILSVF
jgi:hypothetical protein